ncbi:hypothetical protein LIER_38232 [Lithospermum erythrorhizon]|uniref:Transmembrane protein n=1 Tax=Lithospermum erythrorhizon TaxID=34254 RepID=A0AAV3PWZ6_LITER
MVAMKMFVSFVIMLLMAISTFHNVAATMKASPMISPYAGAPGPVPSNAATFVPATLAFVAALACSSRLFYVVCIVNKEY